jgi:hypothetical protein
MYWPQFLRIKINNCIYVFIKKIRFILRKVDKLPALKFKSYVNYFRSCNYELRKILIILRYVKRTSFRIDQCHNIPTEQIPLSHGMSIRILCLHVFWKWFCNKRREQESSSEISSFLNTNLDIPLSTWR